VSLNNNIYYADNYIKEILFSTKSIAIVGLSDKENRPSNFAAKYLKNRGYKIIPINPVTNKPLGFPPRGEPKEQGQYYCSVGTGNAYLSKGSFYDGKASKTVTLSNKDTFHFFLNNINSSAEIEKQTDSIKPIAISNFKKAINIDEELLDEISLNKKEYSHQYVNGFGFGNVKDRLNYNRFSAFKDLNVNRTFNTVLKRFRNNAFQEITSSKSYNSNSNARLNTLSYSYFKE